MTISDVMSVFRQIIACIDKIGPAKVEYVARDMGVDIADLRVWLKLMDALRLVDYHFEYEFVCLKLCQLDAFGFDLESFDQRSGD